MTKNWPEYLGTYKGIVLERGITKTRNLGLPQFVARVALTDYWDTKEGEWFDCSDNKHVMNAYLCLYGRKDSAEDGELEPTLNHQQVCKVFDWDGCGFAALTESGKHDGKIVQVRIAENTGENAKCPVQIEWIDTEDADPNQGLQKLDAKQVKDLEAEFAYLWTGKKATPVVSAKKTVATKAPAKDKAETPKEVAEDLTPPADDKETRKKNLLEKSRRLRNEVKKTADPPAKKEIKKEEGTTAVPKDYGKRQAWSDIIELRNKECTDEQQKASWDAAIAEIADNGDEDKLDADGWWTVKEVVLADVGQF